MLRGKIRKQLKKIKTFDFLYGCVILALLVVYFGHSYWRMGYYALDFMVAGFGLIALYRKRKILNKKYLVWYMVFFCCCALSMLWAGNLGYAFDGVKNVLLILVMLFGVCMYGATNDKVLNLARMYIVACIYMCMRLILFETAEAQVTNDYGQVVGLYFNEVAIILALGVVFCCYFIIKNGLREKKKTLFYLLCAGLFYYIIFVTGSRKGLLMPIVFVLGFAITFSLSSLRSKKSRRLRRGILLIFGAVVVTFMVALTVNPRLDERFLDLRESFSGAETDDASINERAFYREEAMGLFADSPIVGMGVNQFTAHLEKINYWHVAYSHCNYTELLSGLGVIGFIVYYYIYYYIAKKTIKKRNFLSDINWRFGLALVVVLFIFEYGLVDYYLLPVQYVLAVAYMLSVGAAEPKKIVAKNVQEKKNAKS